MESILSEQSATVDELVEACIQAFGWSFEHFFYILNRVNKNKFYNIFIFSDSYLEFGSAFFKTV